MQRKPPGPEERTHNGHSQGEAGVLDPARTPGPFVHRPPFWRARELLRMRRVDQGHARNLVGVPGGIDLGVQAVVRMAYQYAGPSVSALMTRVCSSVPPTSTNSPGGEQLHR